MFPLLNLNSMKDCCFTSYAFYKIYLHMLLRITYRFENFDESFEKKLVLAAEAGSTEVSCEVRGAMPP